MLHRHTRLSSVLVIGALALGTSTLAATQGAASAAPGDSPLTLWAPEKIVTYSYGGRVYTDLGLKVIAPEDPFVFTSTRADDYETPIETAWESGALSGTLPEGTMPNFYSGLPKFAKVVVRDVEDGTVVRRWSQDGCFGETQRVSPASPARSPYPYGCPWNPYTLGSIQGVEAGYATSITGEFYRGMRLDPGKYDVTAKIAGTYTSAIGISAEDAIRTTRLVVKKASDEDFRPTRETKADSEVAQPNAHPPAAPSAVPPPGGPAPDLRSLPAWDIQLNSKGTSLRFAATVWNGGTSPLVVDGFRSEEHPDHMDAYQYFFNEEGEETGSMAVGEMHWHAQNHQHWHFEDFARYRLLNEDLTQRVKSTKQSFCLANTDATDYTVEGADWDPENTDLSTACGGSEALSVRQVLSSGSGDTYMQYRYGQAFRVKNVPNGIYWVSVEANPLGNLAELDETNNQSLRKIKLYGTPDNRKVKVWKVGIVDEFFSDFFLGRR